MALSLQSRVTLPSGLTCPRLGFGTYESSNEEAYTSVLAALRAGYRLIDSAEWYGNEKAVGRAINEFMQEAGVKREEICYTTKIMSNSTFQHASQVIDKSLKLSGLGYIDRFLVHSPYPNKGARLQTWKAMVKAQEEGKIKSLGVSNWAQRHLEELKASGLQYPPDVNQIDLHPFMRRAKEVEFNKKEGIVLEAWGPLARGYRFSHPALKKVATKHSKSTAQVLIRWGLQQGNIVIPKSVNEKRVKANAEVFDFELDATDMKELDGLDEHLVTDWDPIEDSRV